MVQPRVAVKLGLTGALFMQQLHYLSVSKKTNGVMHDGFKWVYNTLEQWQGFFPFLSTKTISRTIQNLEELGVLQSKSLRKTKNDRTKFYRVVYDKLKDILSAPIGQNVQTTTGQNVHFYNTKKTTEDSKENATPVNGDLKSIQEEKIMPVVTNSSNVMLKFLQNSKGDSDNKPTATNFIVVWKEYLHRYNNVKFVPNPTFAEQSMVKKLLVKLEYGQIECCKKVLQNWSGFCGYYKIMVGGDGKAPPAVPTIQFLLANAMYMHGFADSMSSKADSTVQSIAQEKVSASVSAVQSEVPATHEETMDILNGVGDA